MFNKQNNNQQHQQDQPFDYDDPFSRVAKSEPMEGGVYPVPGVYPVLYIDVLKMIQSRKGDDLFIAEMDILESAVSARPAGTRMSWIVNFRHDASPGNIKLFLARLMGSTLEEVTPEAAKFACSAKNPAHGRLIRLEATNVETKAGNDFTKCSWSTLPENMQQDASQLREAAGFPPF